MRRHHLIASLVLSVALIGCTDLLNEDPKGFTTTDTFFKTGADLNSATIAIYNALRGLEGQSQWTSLELASDMTRADNREPNAGTYCPDLLDWDASTCRVQSYWGTMYSVISRANLVLSKGPAIQTPYVQTKTRNLAEAKFLRAYAYLWLTKVYDSVPLLLTPEEQANPRPTRTPVDQIHAAIVKDLTEAEADLPATWPSADEYGVPTQGRIRKGAVQMALADLYLWRSSFMLSNQWDSASFWAKKVIDSRVWSLSNDYLSTFLPKNKGNHEMIFVITNSGVTTNTSSIFQLFYYPRDWGLNFGQGGGWGLIHPTNWFFDSYLPGDYRRGIDSAYTATSAYVWGGCSVSGVCPTYVIHDSINNVDIVRHDTLADGPMPYKYRKSDNGANWQLNDVDVPLYRYAEAILIYAEAQNELGNTGVAVQFLDSIRTRARGGTGAENRTEPHNYGTAGEPTDKLSVREAIFMERAWELSFEAKRWFDLVRRDSEDPGYFYNSLLDHDLNPTHASPAPRAARLANFRKRFPIPQSERNVNPALSQNPGY